MNNFITVESETQTIIRVVTTAVNTKSQERKINLKSPDPGALYLHDNIFTETLVKKERPKRLK